MNTIPIYGEHVAAIDFQEKKIIESELPKKALELVMEWITIHEKELKEIWDTQDLKNIKPLE